jgi:cyclopropane-fatty-acyl-phospholipid synthase
MKRFLLRHILSKRLNAAEVKFPTEIIFANGTSYQLISGTPEITMRFETSWAEWSLVLFDDIGFIESYAKEKINFDQTDGLEKLVKLFRSTPTGHGLVHPVAWLMTKWMAWRTNNARGKNVIMRNLNQHYSLPSEFFHFMTGELYGYTEGYLENGAETQNEAQFKKYEHLCRRLRLFPDAEVVEVGTAWGTMSLLMANKYNVKVTNYGLVDRQNKIFERRIQSMGLGGRIRNVVRDARELGKEKNKYDRYVSLGVFEHAGYHCYEEWLENIALALKPGGVGVMTFTGYSDKRFIHYITDKYIWAGCYLPKIGDVLEKMEKHGLTMVDVENARFFYADTMKVMREKMNTNWETIQSIDPSIFTEHFRRIWNVYYLGAIESFYSEHSTLNAYQVTFVKGRADCYPRTKDFLYAEPLNTTDMKEYEIPLRK